MDTAALRWVESEVERCLNRARAALETYAESGLAAGPLGECVQSMHVARGALEMVECHGAAMLLEELQVVLAGLAQGTTANAEKAADAAVRSLIKISDYIGWLARGNAPAPLVLLPLFNDLRAARGVPLLSETALFAPELAPRLRLPTTRRQLSDDAIRRLARNLRGEFQRGLLEWYRAQPGEGVGLVRVARVLSMLEQVAGAEKLWPLWWVAGGVVDALRKGRLGDGPAVRRVLGQLDASLRALANPGEEPARLQPPVALLKNLLFLTTRVTAPTGRRVQNIRAAFALSAYVAGDEERERAERSFSGPGSETLRALEMPLRGEMRNLQAALDARARNPAVGDERELALSLTRLGDCLGLLDLGAARRALHAAAGRLSAIEGEGESDSALGATAEALLQATDALDTMLESGLERAPDVDLDDAPQQALRDAVIDEIRTNLAGVKHQLATTAPSASHEVERLLVAAGGALRMLGLTAQAGLLERWRRAAVHVLGAFSGTPPRAQLERLAEALLALEMNLAACVGREPRPENALSLVERRIRVAEAAARAAPPVVADAARAAPPPTRVIADHAGESDVIAVFLAECDELVEAIRTDLVGWTDDPRDQHALRELRRAFHTLKGSGRLMGVRNLADLAMAVEMLLGRVVDGTLAPSPALHDALGAACQLLPQVIVAPGEADRAAPVDDMVARLQRLQHEHTADAGSMTQVPPLEAARAGGTSEENLQRMFLDEAGELLDACDAVIQKLKRDPSDGELINELRREVHTLKGSAHVAGLSELGDLSHAMESALAILAEGPAASSQAFISVMEECLDSVSDQLDLVRADRPLAPVDDLVARIEACVRVGSRLPPDTRTRSTAVPGVVRGAGNDRDDRIQVPIGLLDRLTGLAGELGVTQTQLADGLTTLRASLAEMREAVRRVRTQARRLDRDTRPAPVESDAAERLQASQGERAANLRGLARAIAESAEDLNSLWQSLELYADGACGTVAQQSRAGTDLHNELTRARREPFASYVPRLRRIVRRTLQEMGKQGDFQVSGEHVEVDRLLMSRLIPAIEHMLRNAVAHGIEPPAERRARGKSEAGVIMVGIERGSGELLIRIGDDGGGLQRQSIHHAAVARGLLPPDSPVDDPAIDSLILRPGFSTAAKLTRFSGRGLGLDVAGSLVRQLGGEFGVESEPGAGTCFVLRLPLDTTLKQVLLVTVDDGVCALLTSSVAGVLEGEALKTSMLPAAPAAEVEHEGLRYRCIALSKLLGGSRRELRGPAPSGPAVLVRVGEDRFALLVDAVVGRQEIVLSALGPASAGSRHAVGSTILGDGRPASVLDVTAIVRAAVGERERAVVLSGRSQRRRTPLVLVADDSITVRQITSRVLGREGMEVMTAKDGIETLALLREHVPDILVLDIEMPRMDGFQVASAVRADSRLRHLPIVMVTSRVGPKHSERARLLGVDRYLGKPYAEQELVGHIRTLLDTAANSATQASTGT